MSDPFIGEIMMFGGNYAPMDWATCDGQTLSIAQQDALYSLIGTIYGGDGQTNFKLPDLRGRIPVHMGASAPGGQYWQIGQSFGTEQVTINSTMMAAHTHNLVANSSNAGAGYNPSGKVLCQSSGDGKLYASAVGTQVTMQPSVTVIGGGQPHTNMMPAQCLNFIIALNGLYPTRS